MGQQSGISAVKAQLQACRDAEKNNYRAKVEYIYATMNAILNNTPMQEIDDKCLIFIIDAFDKAKEINGDD